YSTAQRRATTHENNTRAKYYPVSFLYGGIEADPDFRKKAIKALSSGVLLPPVELAPDPDDPDFLY
uniref:hypothetical protein n=1 Tax=Bifidobacterium pullorum TaxID=78448 RepID=UPI0029437056